MNQKTQLDIKHERVLSILLNHLYPNGNVAFLLKHAVIVGIHNLLGDIRVHVDLPEGHWAFTRHDEHGIHDRRLSKIALDMAKAGMVDRNYVEEFLTLDPTFRDCCHTMWEDDHELDCPEVCTRCKEHEDVCECPQTFNCRSTVVGTALNHQLRVTVKEVARMRGVHESCIRDLSDIVVADDPHSVANDMTPERRREVLRWFQAMSTDSPYAEDRKVDAAESRAKDAALEDIRCPECGNFYGDGHDEGCGHLCGACFTFHKVGLGRPCGKCKVPA